MSLDSINIRMHDIESKLASMSLKQVMLSELSNWLTWSRITMCKFYFKYANNEQNRMNGRAGKRTRERFGTRNLKLVPPYKHPRKIVRNLSTYRYYDFQRKDWRSFRITDFVVLVEVYDFENEKWIPFNVKWEKRLRTLQKKKEQKAN